MAATAEKFFSARVTSRREIAADLWVIRVDPGGEFSFVAGQYATLGVRTPQKHSERAYSIVSSPYEKELEIFIELVVGGELTPQLHKVEVGGEITLRKIAKGRFTLDLQSGRKNHLLLSTVTGIAPFVSYARTLYLDWREGRMPGDLRLYMINAASRSWEFGYREEMERIGAEVPWLKYVPTVSRPWEDPDWQGEVGRVDDVIRKYFDEWGLSVGDTTAYLCGHPEMIERGMGVLKRRGLSKEQMREEVYWVPAKGTTA